MKRVVHPVIKSLRETRLAWNFTQEEIGHRAGYSAGFVYYAETGQRDPNFTHVSDWAAALGYDLVLIPKGN